MFLFSDCQDCPCNTIGHGSIQCKPQRQSSKTTRTSHPKSNMRSLKNLPAHLTYLHACVSFAQLCSGSVVSGGPKVERRRPECHKVLRHAAQWCACFDKSLLHFLCSCCSRRSHIDNTLQSAAPTKIRRTCFEFEPRITCLALDFFPFFPVYCLLSWSSSLCRVQVKVLAYSIHSGMNLDP